MGGGEETLILAILLLYFTLDCFRSKTYLNTKGRFDKEDDEYKGELAYIVDMICTLCIKYNEYKTNFQPNSAIYYS